MDKSILGEQDEQLIILANDVFLRLDLIFDPLFLF